MTDENGTSVTFFYFFNEKNNIELLSEAYYYRKIERTGNYN
ncbi:hypothetical protein RV06_GL001069 [Enterococcus haemoperoxidus]|nr:hypothetical protein RV06_GL001069 [Enterococcus haemoperoxidus]